MKNKPEIIVCLSLAIFALSLFLGESSVKSALQLTSISVSGYFGFIRQEKE